MLCLCFALNPFALPYLSHFLDYRMEILVNVVEQDADDRKERSVARLVITVGNKDSIETMLHILVPQIPYHSNCEIIAVRMFHSGFEQYCDLSGSWNSIKVKGGEKYEVVIVPKIIVVTFCLWFLL